MARKLNPQEELVFFQFASSGKMVFGLDSTHPWAQPRLAPMGQSRHDASEWPSEGSNLDEFAWPDEWD